MSFHLSNEHIKNQLNDIQFENAMNITSFLTDGIIFSSGYDLPNTEWKNQWIKYCKIIIPYTGFRIEYEHPYKSDKLKDVTQYVIYKGDKLIDDGITHGFENAQSQAYIKLSQIGSFTKIINEGLPKLQWIIDKIPSKDRSYRIREDLKSIVEDKALLREWKLALIDI